MSYWSKTYATEESGHAQRVMSITLRPSGRHWNLLGIEPVAVCSAVHPASLRANVNGWDDRRLSAWELVCHAPLTTRLQVRGYFVLLVSDRCIPVLTLPSGTQRARPWRPSMRPKPLSTAALRARPGAGRRVT